VTGGYVPGFDLSATEIRHLLFLCPMRTLSSGNWAWSGEK
jgi:hypothetical protein